MRFPVVLFDLDGTLVDSGAIILGSFHHATETVLGRRLPDEQILAQVGGTNLAHQMALLDPDRVDDLVRVYREHNDPQYSELAELLKGAPRSAAGSTAPAHGLYLTHVGYDKSPG